MLILLSSFLFINRSWGYSRGFASVHVLLSTWGYVSSEQQQKLELSCPCVLLTLWSIAWPRASLTGEKKFRVQSELLCLCSQTVFSFIPSPQTLFILVLFYTVRPYGAGERKHQTQFPIQWHDCWKQLFQAQQEKRWGGGYKKEREQSSSFLNHIFLLDIPLIKLCTFIQSSVIK